MVTSSNRLPGLRKHLSADVLYEMLRAQCERITDPRGPRATIRLADSVMAAFAMFVIKDPSLLAFDGRRNDQNMKNLFGIETVPSDTQMREILDPLDPAELRPLFSAVFRELQRGKVLNQYVFHKGCYLHVRKSRPRTMAVASPPWNGRRRACSTASPSSTRFR